MSSFFWYSGLPHHLQNFYQRKSHIFAKIHTDPYFPVLLPLKIPTNTNAKSRRDRDPSAQTVRNHVGKLDYTLSSFLLHEAGVEWAHRQKPLKPTHVFVGFAPEAPGDLEH